MSERTRRIVFRAWLAIPSLTVEDLRTMLAAFPQRRPR